MEAHPGDGGTREIPVVISTYGNGRATIRAGQGDGVCAENCAGIDISNLEITGSGRETNQGSGIHFNNKSAAGTKLDYVRITDVDISGFGGCGIAIGAEKERSGYKDVRIVRASLHDNASAGISAWGQTHEKMQGWAHEQIYVGHCRAYNNSGIAAKMDSHSGSGIVIGCVDGGIIEYCEAFNNGWLCNFKNGGPVGIWFWDAHNALIQFCESHHNRTGKNSVDGGGFDLDGGVTHSVIQYNYSHDNDGAGYLLAQYERARPFFKNTVRYNISANDARAHDYGAVHLWSHAAGGIRDVDVYHNTLLVSPSASGTPAAVHCDRNMQNVRLLNNVFITRGSAKLIKALQYEGLAFLGNAYSAETFLIEYGTQRFEKFDAWRSSAKQEAFKEQPFGIAGDLKIVWPENTITIGDPQKLNTLNAYVLQAESPLINKGINLREMFGIDIGTRDFWGKKIRPDAPDVGAGGR